MSPHRSPDVLVLPFAKVRSKALSWKTEPKKSFYTVCFKSWSLFQMNPPPTGPSTRLSKFERRGLRRHCTSTEPDWWRAKCDLRWCGATRRASTYMSRPSYHYYMVAFDCNHLSAIKINHQTWISNTSSLSMLIFKARFHPFHRILAFWFECLSAFVAFDTYIGCLTYIVYIDQKLRHMPSTREIVSRHESWIYKIFWWHLENGRSTHNVSNINKKNTSNLAPAPARLWIS